MLGKPRSRLLLPIDRQIIDAVGFTEAEYLEYLRLQDQLSRTRPAGPVALFGIDDAILIGIAINIALTAATYLLTPRLKSSSGAPGQLRQNDQQGLRLVNRTEFAPKAGISSSQDVVELGSTVPVVFANRETIDGVTYGGVRVNCPLLWSQMVSLGGSQMLRAVYLLGEAPISGVDPTQFAFGENLLSSYDLGAAGNDASARVTIYHRPGGGRIRSTDRIAGRLAANDPGNAEANGAADVFQVRGLNNAWVPATCYSYSPSSQTTFGLYAPIGNGLPFRLNPVMRSARLLATVQAPTRSQREDGYSMIECSPDHAAVVQRQKNDSINQGRGGLTALRRSGSPIATTTDGAPRSLLVGDEVDYYLDNETSASNTFTSRNYSELRGDIGTAIAGRQRQWDDSIIVGETYRIGSAIAICKSRSPSNDVFRSDVQSQPVGGGVAITATFVVVTSGSVDFPTSAPPDPDGFRSGTSRPHIMRMASATIAVPQPAQVIEIGGKSTVGIKVSGFCNLKDSPSYSQIDLNACDIFDKQLLAPNQTLQTTSFQSGTISQIETRYTFWRLRYRIAGSSASWSQFPQLMGVAGSTQQQQYWFNRIEFPSRQRWEVEYQPVSGWEVRSSVATGDLVVIDARLSSLLTLTDGTAVVRVPGIFLPRQQSVFQMPCTIPSAGDVGIPYVDGSNIVDDWGRLAEQFVYEEFSASTSAPEHEIVYVNVIDNAPSTPSYDNLALVAVNIRSGSEASTLGQFSVYVNQAVASHSFPDLLSAGLTNERYGVGSILSPLQVDSASFTAATTWTRGRRYFWDGTLPKPVNIRQWGNDTAALFLLDLVTRNGVSYLQPAVLFGEAESITGIFNGGNIVEGSFKLNYFPQQDRQRIRVSVKWREERAAVGDGSNRGMFPVIREVTVREAGTSETAPIETIDMSEFCTSERHAIDVAKLKCRLKRLSTHQVDLSTIPQQATLSPGRCFRLAMETVSYAKPRNGAILADGTIIASETIADGTYSVLLWDGVGGIQETTITITGGKAVGQGQAVFTIAELAAKEQTYKVQSMGFNETGNIDVVALHWPTDASGYSAVSAGWDVTGNWTIEGAIGSTDAPGTITDSFTGVTIVGASSLTVGIASSYSAVVSGTGTGYSYSWSGTGLTFGSPTASVTTITATSSGTKTASCAVTRGGTTITGTQAIAALLASGTTTIGTVTISGATTGTGVFSSSYSVAISGTATDLVYSWSAPVVPSSRAVTFSATNALAPTITFSGAGTYTLQCRVSSFSATDRSVDKAVTFDLTANTGTSTAHGLAADDEVTFTTTGTLPTGLAERTAYYVISTGLTASAFAVAATPGGTAIDLTGTAAGTHRVNRLGKTDLHTVVIS